MLHIKQTIFKILKFFENIIFAYFTFYSRIQSRITYYISQLSFLVSLSSSLAIFFFHTTEIFEESKPIACRICHNLDMLISFLCLRLLIFDKNTT